MNFASIIAAIADVAEKAAPLIGPEAAAVVDLAESVLKLVDTAKADLPTTAEQRAELSRTRDQLEQQVNAHVDKTTRALRG